MIDPRNWAEPDWKGRERIVTREGEIFIDADACQIVRVEYRRDYGWDVKWFAWFGPFNLFDERQFWTVPVLSQSFLTTTPGSNATWTYDATWNNSNNTIECLGAGGSGSASQITTTTARVYGGGAGGYTRQANVAVSGNTTYRIGLGGTGVPGAALGSSGTATGVDGGDTWWNDTAYPTTGSNKVGAKGGIGGQLTGSTESATGGAGGSSSSAYPNSPTAAYSGGAGGGRAGALNGGAAGGGGAAGFSANGSPGVAVTTTAGTDGGAAGTDTGGTAGTALSTSGTAGAGGDGTYWASSPTKYGSGGGGGGGYTGSNAAVTGGAGGKYGGGGGSARSSGGGNNSATRATSGAGADGIIVLTWTPAVFVGVKRLNVLLRM